MDDREVIVTSYGDTNELIINSDFEYEDQTEFRQSALQFEEHKDRRGISAKGNEGLKIIVATSITFAIGITIALILTIYLGPPVVSSHGAVVSGSNICSEMGLGILRLGGSAVDAAITTTFCVGIVQPHVTGIGGGGFMIIRRHGSKETRVIDFRETAPNHAVSSTNSHPGGFVAIPGLVKGLAEAHKSYGKLPWESLLKPVIKLAKEGINVSKDLAEAIALLKVRNSTSKLSVKLVEKLSASGQELVTGQRMLNSRLVEVLEDIATNGSEVIYSGRWAEDIIKRVNEFGGTLTMSDFNSYKVNTGQSLVTLFHNLTVEVPPAPSAGPLLLLALNIINSFELHSGSFADNITYHYIIESIKATLAQQYRLGDPSFSIGIENVTSEITGQELAYHLRQLIASNMSQSINHYGNDFATAVDNVVSHITVFGFNEDMVSVSSSLGSQFGSAVITEGGIILNNQMTAFGASNSANQMKGGKRPQSYMVPVIVHMPGRVCGPRFALGSSAASASISGLIQVLVNLAVFQLNLNESVKLSRFHVNKDAVLYEENFNHKVISFLANIGHKMEVVTNGISAVDGVAKTNETISDQIDLRCDSFGVLF